MNKVEIYSDGSSRGNPGRGGYGTLLRYIEERSGKVHERQYSVGYMCTTNNRMELLGCIVGFEALNRPCKVVVYSDSKYLTDAFNSHWVDKWKKENWRIGKKNEVKNIDLWKRLLKAMHPHEVTFIWVKGHNSHPENELCDRLATEAADGEDLKEDMGFKDI